MEPSVLLRSDPVEGPRRRAGAVVQALMAEPEPAGRVDQIDRFAGVPGEPCVEERERSDRVCARRPEDLSAADLRPGREAAEGQGRDRVREVAARRSSALEKNGSACGRPNCSRTSGKAESGPNTNPPNGCRINATPSAGNRPAASSGRTYGRLPTLSRFPVGERPASLRGAPHPGAGRGGGPAGKLWLVARSSLRQLAWRCGAGRGPALVGEGVAR
jgi:hypothetical protein